MPAVTFKAQIIQSLTKIAEKLEATNPDAKSNQGKQIAKAFMWGEIADYAKKQETIAMDFLYKDEIIDKSPEVEGNYTLGESPHFFVTSKVSKGRRSFDLNVLADLLKRFKVPKPTVIEFVEKSKVEGKGSKTISIVER